MDLISSIRARLPHYITKANTQRSGVGVQPFGRNKNHPDNPKEEASPFAERQSPQSSVWMRAGAQDSAVHGREIIDASINKDAVNKNERQQGRERSAFIAPSTVKWNLGVWKFVQVDFTWLFQSLWLADGERSPAAPVAWKQPCCINMEERVDLISWSLFELDQSLLSSPCRPASPPDLVLSTSLCRSNS